MPYNINMTKQGLCSKSHKRIDTKTGRLSFISHMNLLNLSAPRTLIKAGFLLCIISSLIIFFSCASGSDSNKDHIVLRFAIFSDNQVGYTAWQDTKDINPSSANIPQLRQTVADITNTDPLPEILFILGDLVMNEVMDNGETLQLQLNAWQEVYDSLPGSQMIPLYPIPGNDRAVYHPEQRRISLWDKACTSYA
jgi:hypothetical protein